MTDFEMLSTAYSGNRFYKDGEKSNFDCIDVPLPFVKGKRLILKSDGTYEVKTEGAK